MYIPNVKYDQSLPALINYKFYLAVKISFNFQN